MYRLFIVEDDDNIRTGLDRFFDWASLDIIPVGSASNGEEALRRVMETRADIVLSDVMMPGMTGLEMAKRLYEMKWNGALVFLSAYGDSQKLQDALRIHAADYVLKPFDDEDMIGAMRRAKEKLAERDAYSELEKSQYWRKVIQGDSAAQDDETGRYVVTLIYDEENSDALSDEIKRLNGIVWSGKISENETVVIWSYEGADQPIDDQMTALSGKYPRLGMHRSPVVAQTWRISSVINQLRGKLAQGSIALGGGTATFMPVEKIGQWILENLRTSEDENWVRNRRNEIISRLNSSEIRRVCDLQDKSIALTQYLSGLLGKGASYDTYETWRKRVSMMLIGCDRADRICEVLITGLQTLHTLSREQRKLNDDYARICRAVEGHLNEVSLPWLVERTGLSKWTITKIIRRENDSTVNEWLQKLRIQEAARLLAETGLKAYEIAGMVGYSSVDYFTTVFRRVMQTTPEQYRMKRKF